MKLFSEWLVESVEKGLPKAEEQLAHIVNQLKQQKGSCHFSVTVPYHWVEGNDLVSIDEDPYKIKDAFTDWDMLQQAGIEGDISNFKVGTHGEQREITFDIPDPNEEAEDQWQQHGFENERDYNSYRFGGRRW